MTDDVQQSALESTASAVAEQMSLADATGLSALPVAGLPGAAEPLQAADPAIQAVAPAYLDQMVTMLDAGGPVVLVLLAMSVFALAIVLLKLWQFNASRISRVGKARRALALSRQGRADEALGLVAVSVNPAAQALALAIRGRQRGVPDSVVREAVFNRGTDALSRLRTWFRPLEVIASLAPLLGLFGTVLGMIKAFQQLENAGSQVNPAILSGGIWEALLTTAVGLAVAIPVVALLNWLERRVDRLAHEMDTLVNRFYEVDLDAEAVELGAPVKRDRLHEEGHHRGTAGLRAATASAGH